MRKTTALRFLLAGLVVPAALLVAGCSDGGDSAGSGETTTTEAGSGSGEPTTTAPSTGVDAGVPPMGTPPSGDTDQYNIAQIAAGTPQTQTVTRLVLQAGLAGTLATGGPFTVFAPVDEAFAAIPADTLRTVNQDIPQLQQVLTLHVVPGTFTTEQLRSQVGQSLTTVQGGKLLIEVKGQDLYVGGAKIAVPDVAASNGIVQVVDTVILEPNGA